MDIVQELVGQSGFANLTVGNLVMFVIAAILIDLAITNSGTAATEGSVKVSAICTRHPMLS